MLWFRNKRDNGRKSICTIKHSTIHQYGKITIVSDEKNIIGLWIEGQKYFANTLLEEPILKDDMIPLTQAKSWLDQYFSYKKPSITNLPLAPKGGEFRQRVWKILCKIPYGKTTTYGEIANQIAKDTGKKSMSAQAVGNAVGHNPISIIIPCHRVIGKNGDLTGYAGGLDKKIKLLQIENILKTNDEN